MEIYRMEFGHQLIEIQTIDKRLSTPRTIALVFESFLNRIKKIKIRVIKISDV